MKEEVEEVDGKNEEWISLWEAPTACVPGALCELAKAIHGAEKRWGQPVVNLGVTAPARSRGKARKSSAQRTGKGFNVRRSTMMVKALKLKARKVARLFCQSARKSS